MIIKGVLETISDGIKHTGSISERAYLKIDNNRLKRVITDDVVDNICQENLGNEIEISCTNSILGKFIGAIREPNGEVTKTSVGIFIFFFLVKLLVITFPVAVFTGIALAIVNISLDIEIPVLISVLWAVWPLITFIKGLVSRNALK